MPCMSNEGNAVQNLYSSLPSLDELLRSSEFVALLDQHSRAVVTDTLRAELARARDEIAQGVHSAETLGELVDGLGAGARNQRHGSHSPH
jgi:hypothetical protein